MLHCDVWYTLRNYQTCKEAGKCDTQPREKSGETNPEITDGKIRHKPKIAYEYIQGFKESPEHNEGKYRESQ